MRYFKWYIYTVLNDVADAINPEFFSPAHVYWAVRWWREDRTYDIPQWYLCLNVRLYFRDMCAVILNMQLNTYNSILFGLRKAYKLITTSWSVIILTLIYYRWRSMMAYDALSFWIFDEQSSSWVGYSDSPPKECCGVAGLKFLNFRSRHARRSHMRSCVVHRLFQSRRARGWYLPF